MGNANSSNSSRSNTETAVERDVEAVSSGPVASPGISADGRIPTTTVNASSPHRTPKVELNVNAPARKFRQTGAAGVNSMGNYPVPHISKLSYEERFAEASSSRSVSMDGLAGMPVGSNSSLSTAPPTSSTPQSNGPHSRRPSALGSSVSVKDSDNVPTSRKTAGTAKSAIAFGSIDDAVAPVFSSPASAPAMKSTAGHVTNSGSVAIQNGASRAAFTQPSSLSATSNASTSSAPAPSSIPRSKGFDVSNLSQGPNKMTSTPPSARSIVSPGKMPPAMSSPRLGSHPTSHPGQKAGQPLLTPPVRQGYYPPQQRRKLQLLPRLKPVETKDATTAGSEATFHEEDGKEEVSAISKADALEKIGEDTKKFFSTRSLDEAETYFSTLPQEHRFRLVDRLAMQAVKSEADAQLVANFFTRVREKNLATPALLEEGLMPLAEIIDSIEIEAPKPLYLFAIMLKGAGLHEDEERRARIAAKSMDNDKLLSLLTLNARVDYWHDAQFKKQIFRDIAEFFRLRLVSEAEAYFVNLPPMHRPFLIRKIAERAMTSSLDADLAVDLFQTVWRRGLCSEASLEYGLGLLDDFPRP